MKTEDITQPGYYWVWIGDEWRAIRYPSRFGPSPDGSMAGRHVVGPIIPPSHSPGRMAELERAEGCGARLAPGQYWGFCGETDMGQTLPALCKQCGGEFIRE